MRSPEAWSQVMIDAAPLSAAALQVKSRKLIQPGADGSKSATCRRAYNAYETTVMCKPYERAMTVNTGPAAARGTSGFSRSSSSVETQQN